MKLYKTKSKEHRIAILAALLKLGYLWHKETKWTPESIEESYPFENYPVIETRETMGIYGNSGNQLCVSLEELLNPTEKQKTLMLGEYNATITANSEVVQVGCKEFNINRIKEVVRVWDELNPTHF